MRGFQRNYLRLLFSLAAVCALFTAACSSVSAPPRGTVEIAVINEGGNTIEDVIVTHDGQEFETIYLGPGSREETRFFFNPDSPLEVHYVHRGRRLTASYPLRALQEHSGRVELRFDRDGQLQPVERFFIR